jgi:hypothetical protein
MKKTNLSAPKSFKEIVYPIMEKDGFVDLTTKIYARVVESNLLQFLIMHVRTGLRKEFCLEYGTMLLSVKSESFKMTIGSRAKKLSSGGYYGAFSEKALSKSIERTLTAYEEEIRPFFLQTDSIKKYLPTYQEKIKEYPNIYKNGHADLELACAYLLDGDEKKAKDFVLKAIERYQQEATDKNCKLWADKCLKDSKELCESISNGTYIQLLSDWLKFSRKNLKLKEI